VKMTIVIKKLTTTVVLKKRWNVSRYPTKAVYLKKRTSLFKHLLNAGESVFVL